MIGRAALGLFVGALIGTGVTAMAWIVLAMVSGEAGMSILFTIIVIPASFVAWSAGLVLLGVPGWFVLHATGARSQKAAMIYGASLPTLVVVLVQMTTSSKYDDWAVWIPPLLAAGVGAVIGWVIARIAYGRANAS